MEFIKKIIKKYGEDKIQHFLGGGWIVSMFTPLGWFGVLGGFILMIILSFIKEKFFDNFFDKKDIIAACLGGGVSVIVYTIIWTILLIV